MEQRGDGANVSGSTGAPLRAMPWSSRRGGAEQKSQHEHCRPHARCGMRLYLRMPKRRSGGWHQAPGRFGALLVYARGADQVTGHRRQHGRGDYEYRGRSHTPRAFRPRIWWSLSTSRWPLIPRICSCTGSLRPGSGLGITYAGWRCAGQGARALRAPVSGPVHLGGGWLASGPGGVLAGRVGSSGPGSGQQARTGVFAPDHRFCPGESLPNRVSRCENEGCHAAPDPGSLTHYCLGYALLAWGMSEP